MKLVLLGTTGYHPNELRHTACVMLPEAGVVLDAGTGFFRVRERLVTDTLDIFLTHAHLDHVVGLTFLLDTLYGRALSRVTVHGNTDKLAAIRAHLFHEAMFPVAPPCEFRSLDGPVTLRDGGTLTHFPLVHPGGAVGFRLDWPDRSMAYVTDTTAEENAEYIQSIRGVNVLIHECYFGDEHADLAARTGHSCTTPVLKLAKAAEVGQLILVHVNPLATGDDPVGLAGLHSIFPAAELGRDGMEIEF